ncbi:MAG TPA: DUF805 domain-containing protein [Burkholderiales bacterium]|nr:DUF805 domain-containing protein [Burkholderiales bacterium]
MDSDAPLSRLFRLYFSPGGRIARATYWIACIALGIAFVAAFIALESVAGRKSTLVLYPLLLWAMLMLATKRCHDRAKSPLWLLLVLIPVLGPLWWLIALGLRRGTLGENQYGNDPLENSVDYLIVA